MAEPEDFDVRDLAHISIDALRETADYEFPKRNQDKKPLRADYVAHATSLLNQLANALGQIPAQGQDARLQMEGLKAGTIVQIETVAPEEGSRKKAVKLPTGIEFPTQEILVLQTRRNDDKTESALLFIPDDARAFLQDRLRDYGNENLGNRDRPDVERFEAVEKIEVASASTLFIGDVDLNAPDAAWWEVWVRGPALVADRFAVVARNANLDVHADRLFFPDTTVVFVYAAAPALVTFGGRVPGVISEIRKSTGTIETFLAQNVDGGVGQQDWVENLSQRVTPPPADVPVVCGLDTGVNAAHPLVAPGLQGRWAYDPAWGTDDHHPQGGHGTALTSLLLYGDLESLMNDNRAVALTHAAESMKLLPPRGFPRTRPPSYGVVTQGAVSSVEIERPNRLRSYCLAVSTAEFPPGRPSSWSGALDQIIAGSMPGDRAEGVPASQSPKRLMVVATGNVEGGAIAEVTPCQPLEDPAQSWNGLTVGGFTRKEQVPAAPPDLKPVVPANNRSPFSRGSNGLPDDLMPIKPEVLFEAGNMLADAAGNCDWSPSVSLLAAGSDVVAEPLIPFWATSAAAGMAGNFIGQLHAQLPQFWPETLRALTVDSAQWPIPIRQKFVGRGAHWKTGTKGAKLALLREFGYGVPDLDRALKSAKNDVTLIAEAEIQPFAIGADGRTAKFNDMHFYELPWPKAALEQLENKIVTMRVTLSYFIEPNLAGKAVTRPDTYRSFGLRFAMKNRNETKAKFRSRISASQEKDDIAIKGEKSCWLLGPKAIQAGSLHCDLWRGHAIDLAGHDSIAVYPVGGWWKSHAGQRRMNDKGRYALTISIAAPDQDVDLYAEVEASVLVKAAELAAKVAVPAQPV